MGASVAGRHVHFPKKVQEIVKYPKPNERDILVERSPHSLGSAEDEYYWDIHHALSSAAYLALEVAEDLDYKELEGLTRQNALVHEVAVLPSPLGLSPSGKRQTILDTGSTLHLCPKDEVPRSCLKEVRLCSPVRLASANGVITADEEVPIRSPALDAVITRTLLEGCPNAFSVGKLAGSMVTISIGSPTQSDLLSQQQTDMRYLLSRRRMFHTSWSLPIRMLAPVQL